MTVVWLLVAAGQALDQVYEGARHVSPGDEAGLWRACWVRGQESPPFGNYLQSSASSHPCVHGQLGRGSVPRVSLLLLGPAGQPRHAPSSSFFIVVK